MNCWKPYPFTEEEWNTKGIKLHLGPNQIYLNGFQNIDIDNPVADVNADATKLTSYKDNSVSLILASHLLEHFDSKAGYDALCEWYRVLRPGGWLVMEMPDIVKCFKIYMDCLEKDNFDSNYDMAMIGIYGRADWSIYQLHRWGYTPKTLSNILSKVGFKEINELEPLDSTAKNYSFRVDCKK